MFGIPVGTLLQILVYVLKGVNAIFGNLHDQGLIKAGADAEIAKSSKAILDRTALGKVITEKLDAMPPAERDAFTDALGRTEPGGG